MDEEFKEEVNESNKKDRRNVIIVILLIIILVLVAGIFVYFEKDSLLPTEEPEPVEIVREVTEIEKESVKRKLYRVLNISESYNNLYGFRGDALKRTLTDGEKQYIVVRTAKYDEITTDAWKEIPKVKEDIETDLEHNHVNSNITEFEYIKQEYSYLSFENMNKEYISMFGNELTEPLEEIRGCPNIYYFKDYNVYYKYPARCGGTSAGYSLTYLDNYRKTDDEIVVDLYVGIVGPSDSTGDLAVYSDFETYDETGDGVTLFSSFKGINDVTTEEKDDNGNYIINDNNKELFSKYTVYFKQLDDDYYFYKVKQGK